MGGPPAARAALAALLLAASAACNSSSKADRDTAAANTVATEPAPTTTTNPYAIPAVIDEAYVNRVLAGLDAAMGDVTRLVVQTRTITREAFDRMKALYADNDNLQLTIDSFESDMRNNFAGYRSAPGNKVSRVTQLITVRSNCIFAQVTRDYSAVGINSSSSDIQWIALRPVDRARDPQGYNQTNWAFAYEGFTESRNRPRDPCAA